MKINTGKKIDDIHVTLSYRIIELFSAGLYSSPNKAFEELVCNSYDAHASKVGVYVSSDLAAEGAYMWVCDNGDSMNHDELKNLWKVGESTKRLHEESDSERLPIGRFGIGKLATYILANNLTYICKKNDRYLATQMDYTRIHKKSGEHLTLDEIELSENEVRSLLQPYIKKTINPILPFDLFGEEAEPSWTFSIMTALKAKSTEIKEGRLKWILKTALPLNPKFKLFYNGVLLESSKIKIPLVKTWIVGRDDETMQKMDNCIVHNDGENYYVDFPHLKNVHGICELFEDSLVEGKSSELGRSHGIFLMVRNRLINLDDPLLGMDAFSHGAFNRTRITIYADELDENIASTREIIKESKPFSELKEYIKKKFNNEIRKIYFEKEKQKEDESSISYRLAQTSTSLSRTPIVTFAKKFFNDEIISPWLILPIERGEESKENFIAKLEKDVEENNLFTGSSVWEIMPPEDPIAKFSVEKRTLRINLMHPFIANYSDEFKSKLPIEFIAITEVLTEAHMYEICIPEESIHAIMKRRDKILRELVFGDRASAPLVAGMVKDALSDSTGLEDAIYKAFHTLGFETTKIGGSNNPDGYASAILGFSEENKSENYSLTYDAKSTGKNKIQAGTARLSALYRQKEAYKAQYSVVVAIDYEGADNPEGALNIELKQQKITAIRAKDLMRLLLLAVPKQIGLKKLRDMFETCHTPNEVKFWIDEIEKTTIDRGPIDELLEVIYVLQKEDTEPPKISAIRSELKHLNPPVIISESNMKGLLNSLLVLVPGFINIEGEKVSINTTPSAIKTAIQQATNNVPADFQQMYIDALCAD